MEPPSPPRNRAFTGDNNSYSFEQTPESPDDPYRSPAQLPPGERDVGAELGALDKEADLVHGALDEIYEAVASKLGKLSWDILSEPEPARRAAFMNEHLSAIIGGAWERLAFHEWDVQNSETIKWAINRRNDMVHRWRLREMVRISPSEDPNRPWTPPLRTALRVAKTPKTSTDLGPARRVRKRQ